MPRPALGICAIALSALALIAGSSTARAQETPADIWHLVAIDGLPVSSAATLEFGADGAVSGQAPCNRWFARNDAKSPALSLTAIGATRMACDGLAEEQRFFKALALMQTMETVDDRLILRNADGATMEFSGIDGANCTTCAPEN